MADHASISAANWLRISRSFMVRTLAVRMESRACGGFYAKAREVSLGMTGEMRLSFSPLADFLRKRRSHHSVQLR